MSLPLRRSSQCSSSQESLCEESPNPSPPQQTLTLPEASLDQKAFLERLLKSDPLGKLSFKDSYSGQRKKEQWKSFEDIVFESKPTKYVRCKRDRCHALISRSSGHAVFDHHQSCSRKKQPLAQPSLPVAKKPKAPSPHIKKRLKGIIARYALESNISFNFAGSRRFGRFLTDIVAVSFECGFPIDFSEYGVLPDRFQGAKNAEKLGEGVRMALEELLQSDRVLSIAATCDHWTDSSNKHHFLGITAQCVIDGETLKQEHFVLSSQRSPAETLPLLVTILQGS